MRGPAWAFALDGRSGDGELPKLSGAVDLTADFDANTVDGSLSLSPINSDLPNHPISGTVSLALESAGDRYLSGRRLLYRQHVVGHGQFGVRSFWEVGAGQFFGAPGGVPPNVAGTFGAEKEDLALVGAFVAGDTD